MARARGVIFATAHLGNWELGGRLLAQRGRPTHVVLAAEEDPSVEAFLRQSTNGMRFVTLGQPTTSLALLAALRRNEIVALQGDRPTRGPSDVPMPFFGAPAIFPLGPFRLAAASGAPVLPVFSVFAEEDRYRIYVEAPIGVDRGGKEAGLAQLVAILERYLAAFPDQWFAFYDVWGARGSA
jgi:KDO2-lipid IV(A) lauroyltransferase